MKNNGQLQHEESIGSPYESIRQSILESIAPPPIMVWVASPRDQYKRVTVEAIADADGLLVHKDSIRLDSASARSKFARDVAKHAQSQVKSADIETQLLELDDEQDAPKNQEAAFTEEDIDPSSIVPAGSFITETLAGRLVSRLVKLSGPNQPTRIEVRDEFLLIHTDGSRKIAPFSTTLNDADGRSYFVVGEPPVSNPQSFRPMWTRESYRRWLEGKTPSIEGVRDRLAEAIGNAVWLPSDVEDKISLLIAAYIILTYVSDAIQTMPYLHVTGPKGSGKTQGVLRLIGHLAYRPFPVSDISSAIIYRTLDAHGGTLILDEAEKLDSNSEKYRDITGLLNAGHTKGFPARRCEKIGDAIVVHEYDCYGPKVLTSIAPLPDALASRCIRIPMLRQPRDYSQKKQPVDLDVLRDDINALTMTHAIDLRKRLNSSGDYGLANRARDLWAPIIKIADWLDPGQEQKLADALCDYAKDAAREADEDLGVPEADQILLTELYRYVSAGTHITTTPSSLLSAVQRTWQQVFANWTPARVGQTLKNYGVKSNRRRVHKGEQIAGGEDWAKTYHKIELDRLAATMSSYGVPIPTVQVTGGGVAGPQNTPVTPVTPCTPVTNQATNTQGKA